MKRLLIYGDSNTWGYNPHARDPVSGAAARYCEDERWPTRMAAALGDGFRVYEAALNGRTTAFDDPLCPGRSGAEHIGVALRSCDPVDLVAVMLGTNDTKDMFSASAAVIAEGMELLLDRLEDDMRRSLSHAAKLLLISPVAVAPTRTGAYCYDFSEKSTDKAARLAGFYRDIARRRGAGFLHAAEFAPPDPVDGIHLDAAGHAALAAAVGKKILEML